MIKSLNENNYSTINDLMNRIYEIINEFYSLRIIKI